jgi:hypothetical protein
MSTLCVGGWVVPRIRLEDLEGTETSCHCGKLNPDFLVFMANAVTD